MPRMPRKVTIKCACFHSKVVESGDTTDSQDGKIEEKGDDDDDDLRKYMTLLHRRKSISLPDLSKIGEVESDSSSSSSSSN